MRQSLSPTTLAPNAVLLKRYRIEELIGSGGYASVYRATDLTFGYERAIKEVTDQDTGVRQQFELEADLLINIKHPNIPQGYLLIHDRGRMYLVMEYIRGDDLEETLNKSLTQSARPLEEAQVLRWALDVCGALIVMHSLPVPIIHRDIKPANIKITLVGRPVLIDFGLAKLQRKGRPTLTAAQGVSPGFAPPEQYMAKGRTDGRTDIYGLGATLYACLTGKDPPEAPARLLAQTDATRQSNSMLVSPRRHNPSISEPTERLIMRALELAPGQRQQTAAQLEQEIGMALHSLANTASGGHVISGWTCPRCGTRNASTAEVCTLCHAAVPPLARATAHVPALPGSSAGSSKRPAVAGVPRVTAQGPAMVARRPAPAAAGDPYGERPPDAFLDRNSARQRAVMAETRTGQQPAVTPHGAKPAALAEQISARHPIVMGDRSAADRPESMAGRTGKQAAMSPRAGTGVYPTIAGAAAPAPRESGTLASAPHMATAAADRRGAPSAIAEREPVPRVPTGAWIRLGTTALGGFGRWMLALAGVEVLWGAMIVAVGAIVLLAQGRPFPLQQFVIAWGIAAAVASLIGGQIVNRPVYRRGKARSGRRIAQGFGLALYTLVVHAVAMWGATIFATAQSNALLAVAAFMLFGVNVLVVGMLSIANVLG